MKCYLNFCKLVIIVLFMANCKIGNKDNDDDKIQRFAIKTFNKGIRELLIKSDGLKKKDTLLFFEYDTVLQNLSFKTDSGLSNIGLEFSKHAYPNGGTAYNFNYVQLTEPVVADQEIKMYKVSDAEWLYKNYEDEKVAKKIGGYITYNNIKGVDILTSDNITTDARYSTIRSFLKNKLERFYTDNATVYIETVITDGDSLKLTKYILSQ